MDELSEFGTTILLVGIGLTAAIAVRVLAVRVAVPAAAMILVATAVLSDVFDQLYDEVRIVDVQRVATLALIVILLDGRHAHRLEALSSVGGADLRGRRARDIRHRRPRRARRPPPARRLLGWSPA